TTCWWRPTSPTPRASTRGLGSASPRRWPGSTPTCGAASSRTTPASCTGSRSPPTERPAVRPAAAASGGVRARSRRRAVEDEVADGRHGGDDVAGRLGRRARVERRLRVVLDAELDGLGGAVAVDAGGQREG